MNAAALLALQKVDTAIDAVANRRVRLPEIATRREAAAALAAHRTAIAEQQRLSADAQARIDDSETSSHAIDTKKARLEAQLKTVIAPREAEALMSEIRTLDAERSELDEAELVAMEEQAGAEAALAALRDAEPSLAEALAAAEAALAAANAALDAEQASLAEQRTSAASALGAAELSTYESARSRFGGVAVASLDGHKCSGCNLDLSPAEVDEVKRTPAGEPAECPQCARYLVR